MTTGKLDVFERGVYRAEMLNYALGYLRDNDTTFKASFDRAKAKGAGPPFADFKAFQGALLGAVVYGSLALVWGALEAYGVSVFGRPVFGKKRGIEIVQDRCPKFTVLCHHGHSQSDVLTVLKDVRDWELHALIKYNNITCDRHPDELMLQPILVREFSDHREVLLFGGMTVGEQLNWLHALPISKSTTNETLGEFLVEEAVECVRAFDAASTPTGAFTGGPCRGPKLPATYPLPPP